MNSWENNSISPEFHPATKPLTVEPVDSGNEIAENRAWKLRETGNELAKSYADRSDRTAVCDICRLQTADCLRLVFTAVCLRLAFTAVCLRLAVLWLFGATLFCSVNGLKSNRSLRSANVRHRTNSDRPL